MLAVQHRDVWPQVHAPRQRARVPHRTTSPGLLYAPDMSSFPWEPGDLVAVAQTAGAADPAEAIREFFSGNLERYHDAVAYYDLVVGAADHA